MNETAVHCRVCEIELTGSKKTEFFQVDNFVHLITSDSEDCNWHRCNSCKDTLCKRCYARQGTHCCEADYIAQRERAQMLAEQQQNRNTIYQEEGMSDFKIVYLIVERGVEPNRQVFWRSAGSAFICRDGSLNVKLDIHPGLTFNIRDPKSYGEREEAESFPNLTNGNSSAASQTVEAAATARTKANGKKSAPPDDDIPF